MRRRRLSVIVVFVALTTIIISSLAACTPGGGGTGTVKPPATDDITNNKDGFVKDTASVDDVCKDLIKTILNSAYTASKDRLTESNPYVSWWIDLDCNINGNKGLVSFKVNFDVRNPESMTVRLSLLPDGYKNDSLEFVFFADKPSADGKDHPGSLYMRVGDSKIVVPLSDSVLSDMFPLDSYKADDLISFIAGRLATLNKISYEYKDEIGDKRTRKYAVQVDVKQTIINVLTLLNTSATKNEYDSVKWIVENAFGISIANIATDMPSTQLDIKFVTEGGMRSAYGTGTLKELSATVKAEANGKTNSVFKGEKFNGQFEVKKFSALRKLIDMPSRTSLDNDGYKLYNSSTVNLKTELVYKDSPSKVFDFDLAFRYGGIEDHGANDTALVRISDDDGEAMSLYYANNVLYLNHLDIKTNVEHNINIPFDLDKFIIGIENSINGRDSMDVLKALTFVIGSLQFGDNATKMSYTFDARFFNGVLNIDLETLYTLFDDAYKCAGGTGFVRDRFEDAGINLGDIVYDRALTLTADLTSSDMLFVSKDLPDLPTGDALTHLDRD